MTPKQTIKTYCVHCLGLPRFDTKVVSDCEGDQAANGACPFFPYRMGKRPPVKIFRAYCLYCQGGSREAVASCPVESCPVHPYRFGKNPKLIGRRQANAGSYKPKVPRDAVFLGQISTNTGRVDTSPPSKRLSQKTAL